MNITKIDNCIYLFEEDNLAYYCLTLEDDEVWTHWCRNHIRPNDASFIHPEADLDNLCHCCYRVLTDKMRNHMRLYKLSGDTTERTMRIVSSKRG